MKRKESRKIGAIAIAMIMVFSMLIGATFVGAAEPTESGDVDVTAEEECDACAARPSPQGSNLQLSSSAPGYCPSYGGSHEFEYISSVTYTQKPGGTAVITAGIYIANPTGCVYGEPCPEYDNSPEYVNAWIDWNGDQVWEAGERIMDKALTGYVNINYHGTMTASNIVTIPPDAVSSTWMRVNLGWDDDPNDPCTEYWTWGDVVDKEVQIEVAEPPEIEKIVITPKNPMTNHDVTFKAEISDAPEFEITGVDWIVTDVASGNIDFFDIGKKNPYTHKPAPDAYGKKEVLCTIFYEHKVSGATGLDQESKEFKLFFEKQGNYDGDDEPNWFEYWQKNNACPDLNQCEYDSAETGFGGYSPSLDKVTLGPLAAQDNKVVTIPTLGACGGGLGIDCCYQTVAHELKHKWVADNWKAGGIWNGKTDTDGDELPDDWEDTYTYKGHKFSKANNDTYNVHLMYAHWGDYWSYGDQEALCRIEENGKVVAAEKDWACPGKQSDPVYDGSTEACPAGGSVDCSAKPILISELASLGSSLEISSITEQAIDSDGDGKYNNLRVTINFTSDEAMSAQIIAKLFDADENMICMERIYPELVVGYQQLQLDFDGTEIRNSGKNGPYTLNVSFYTVEHDAFLLDSEEITTQAYSFTDFQPQDAVFSGVYADQGIDTDADGVYDYLAVETEINVTVAGIYTVEGYLYGDSETAIAFGSNTAYLDTGTQTVVLNFEGLHIAQSKIDGPYTLSYLTLYDEDENTVDFVYQPYETSAYSYTDFQSPTGFFRDTYSDYGVDTNGDGFYEYLTVEVGLNVITAGNYSTHGCLYDEHGNEIAGAYILTHLDTGNQTVTLNFAGNSIYKHGVSGSYNLSNLLLFDENGTLMDNRHDAYTTSAYDYANFQSLIRLTGNYADYGTDTDGNGLFDYLTIEIGVMLASEGHCVATARIVDENGEEIAWASDTTLLSGGEPQAIQLDFDGLLINQHRVDGPYYLKDVYVYHTGDPALPDYVCDAYTTSVYDYTDFETVGWDPWVYDGDGSGYIEIGELLQAINDYIGGDITISQLLELINLYISHTPK